MRIVTVAVGTLAVALALHKLTDTAVPSTAATDDHPANQPGKRHSDQSAQSSYPKTTASVAQPERLPKQLTGVSKQAAASFETAQPPIKFRPLPLPTVPMASNPTLSPPEDTVSQPTRYAPQTVSPATLDAAVDKLVTQDISQLSPAIAPAAAISPPSRLADLQESSEPPLAEALGASTDAPLLVASAATPSHSDALPAQPAPDQASELLSPPPAPSPAAVPEMDGGFSPVSTRNPQEIAALPTQITQEDEYVLGGGDRIRVDVFGVPEYSGEYQVLVNGTVNLPLVGNIRVDGMTLKQASTTIAARYAPLLKRSLVTVNLLNARSLRVAVSGEVSRPGSYPLTLEGNKFPSVTRILQTAGGVTRAADLRKVQVRRPQRDGSEKLITLNLWNLLQTGNLRQDLLLRDGDSVFIPASAEVNLAESPEVAAANIASDLTQPIRISVVGEVNRPGPRILAKESTDEKSGSVQPTVSQALQQAGGITQLADLRHVQIRRPTRSGAEQTIQVDLWNLLQTGDLKQDLILQQGDTILVPTATALSAEEAIKVASATFSPNSIKVNIVGEVLKPGVIEIPPNTPLNQAILTVGGYNSRARTSPVELIRLNPNGTVSRQTVRTNLSAAADQTTNPMLRNGDIIVVDRSKISKFTDTLNTILTPLGRVLPLVF
ncbi:MAG: polysaccharide export protein [Leptolyngbyaceae cyanobacterium RU_5_1]|nr:polysaccharide export protein [Leptolyngbyaceae cyanobacterium RU_5_1]